MLWGSLLCGQTVIAPVVEGGASVPAPPCVTGQLYFNTGAAAGQNLYVCAGNTWTQITGAAATGVSTNASNTYAAGTVQSFLGTLDASGAAATLPAQTGATLPATCSMGQLFLKTGADPSRMLYICSAANTWSQVGFAQGTTAQKPASCAAGQMYFATDATAGSNLYFCTGSNIWTQMALPTQTGNAGAYLSTDGTNPSWKSVDRGAIAGGYWDLRGYFANGISGSQVTNGANATNALMVYFPRLTFNTVYYQVTSACASCSARFAIYAMDKTTRIWDSGPLTDTTSPGIGSIGTFGITTTLDTIPEGWAYLVWATTTTSLQLMSLYSSGSYQLAYNPFLYLDAPTAGHAATNANGSPYNLPASLGVIAGVDSSYVPEFLFVHK
jgi:hypothetical protein